MSAPMDAQCAFSQKVENSSDSSSESDNEESKRLKEAVIGESICLISILSSL